LYVLIGAERGFCGGYNEAVLRAVGDRPTRGPSQPAGLIAIGGKLAAEIRGDPRLIASLAGPSTAEEVPQVLNDLVETLSRLAAERGPSSLEVVHWDPDDERVEFVPVLPPFAPGRRPSAPGHRFPPRLNLTPARFLEDLVERYLFAVLHEMLYGSLMAEHRQRVRHLEGALQRVSTRTQELRLRRNALRQEEITEEIELIMLNLPASDFQQADRFS
jgi:F-type H+-transporting ATPase subunit gamma